MLEDEDRAKPNRRHKDSVFTKLFSDEDKALELYNAISGKNYPKGTKVKIVTLPNVLYMKQLNDLAFVIDDKLIVLVEHQSTINRNIPLRFLMYAAREYEKITDESDLYKESLLKVPEP